MKTSTKTNKARIVIGELPSAGTSGPRNLNSAAVAAVHGCLLRIRNPRIESVELGFSPRLKRI